MIEKNGILVVDLEKEMVAPTNKLYTNYLITKE